MAFEDHLDFLDVLKKVKCFAIDEESFKDESLTDDAFFKYIYTCFSEEDEKAVKRAVQTANTCMVIVAPLGGGKTSLLRNTLRSSVTATGKKNYFLFDFKKEIEEFYGMGHQPDQQMLFIRDIFKRKLGEQFLSDPNDKIRFVFNALRMFFTDQLHYRIFKWRVKHFNPNLGDKMDDVLKLFFIETDVIAEDQKTVMQNITCSQMISAIKTTLGFEKFLIVLDNVDRLPTVHQPVLFSVAIDIHHGGAGAYGTLLAVRNKTLMRYEGAGSFGNMIEVVSIMSDSKELIKPIRLHAPTAAFAKELLEKRQNFLDVYKLDEETKKHIINSKQIFNAIRPFLNEEFIEERFYNLANHSFKQMLVLYLEFIRYLYRLIDANVKPGQTVTSFLIPASLVSYLYRWSYASHTSNHEFLLDIVTKYDKHISGTLQTPLECDIEIVLLAWLASARRSFLRVKEVVKSFRIIGVADGLIESLYRLYDVDMSHRYVDLGDTEEKVSIDDLEKNNLRVTLNPLGLEFVRYTITKFEFLHQCLAYPDVVNVDSPEMLEEISKDIEDKINTVFEFLEKMKKVHAESLLKIRDACSRFYPKWEEYYRNRFCIDNRLVLERIIFSHLSHFKKTYKEVYPELRIRYENLLDDYYTSFGSTKKASEILKGH